MEHYTKVCQALLCFESAYILSEFEFHLFSDIRTPQQPEMISFSIQTEEIKPDCFHLCLYNLVANDEETANHSPSHGNTEIHTVFTPTYTNKALLNICQVLLLFTHVHK